MATTPNDSISVSLSESRSFPPPAEFRSSARNSPERIERLRRLAKESPEAYWVEAARSLQWDHPFSEALTGTAPFYEWFRDGKINASTNCLDRHLSTRGDSRALVWEGEPTQADGKPEIITWTYRDLHRETAAFTAALRKLGLRSGDRVALYLPMVPEAVVAMLACARAGLTHTVIFGGFSSDALRDRVNDAGAVAILTADFGYRKGAAVPLREQVLRALAGTPTVRNVVTLGRMSGSKGPAGVSGDLIAGSKAKESDWVTVTNAARDEANGPLGAPESVPSEHPLFILYTSGTTGKPKGLVHSTGGYLTGVARSTELVFDQTLGESKLAPDLYWCTADIGWITGHSYVVYGPLAMGAGIFIYEGAPTTPGPGRFWEMIERHRISILYTAPTAIRSFMRLGTEAPRAHDLSSLRLLGTVGEPINPEAWMWYRAEIGGERCPIVDTYWQTETGSIVIAPIPGETTTKPGSATLPLPGIDAAVLDRSGTEVGVNEGGLLCIRHPFPSLARTIYGDPERFQKTYFSEFPGAIYFTGDGARRDADDCIWCLGRVDDVLNVSGHRLGTMEIESALVGSPLVAEAAVVGRPDELKGQGIVAFVTLKAEHSVRLRAEPAMGEPWKKELRAEVTRSIGALARPDEIRFTDGLPKTRSGKIMRRLLRELATTGDVKGDTTTLEDLNVIAALRAGDEE